MFKALKLTQNQNLRDVGSFEVFPKPKTKDVLSFPTTKN
jgi:hypothetical protein